MSRRGRGHRKDGRSKREGPYAPLPYSMLHHTAWRSLSGPAVKVWLELRSRYNGSNNGKIHLSMREAAELLGLSKSTVQRAYEELEAKGFIIMHKQGHWYGRLAHEWEVTDKPCNGQPAKRAWQSWQSSNAKTECGTEAGQ